MTTQLRPTSLLYFVHMIVRASWDIKGNLLVLQVNKFTFSFRWCVLFAILDLSETQLIPLPSHRNDPLKTSDLGPYIFQQLDAYQHIVNSNR